MSYQNNHFEQAANSDLARQQTVSDAQKRAAEMRAKLYNVLVRFRKEAASTNDQTAKVVYEFSAEIIVGLARALRQFENGAQDDDSADPANR